MRLHLVLLLLAFPAAHLASAPETLPAQNQKIKLTAARDEPQPVSNEHGDQIVRFNPGKDDENYTGGKRYGMLILKVGTELLGYLEIKPDGSVLITENSFFDNNTIALENIRSIRWLHKIVVKLKSREIILGHLVREEAEHILLETLTEPKTIKKIRRADIETQTLVKSLEVSKKRQNRPRVFLDGGYAISLGKFAEAFRSGPMVGITVQQSWAQFLRWNSSWIPDIRADANMLQFASSDYEYRGLFVNIGPLWVPDILGDHKGVLSIAVMPGIVWEKARSPNAAGENRTLSAQLALSYDYPLYKKIFVGINLKGLYSHDNFSPLFVSAALLRVGYQF